MEQYNALNFTDLAQEASDLVKVAWEPDQEPGSNLFYIPVPGGDPLHAQRMAIKLAANNFGCFIQYISGRATRIYVALVPHIVNPENNFCRYSKR